MLKNLLSISLFSFIISTFLISMGIGSATTLFVDPTSNSYSVGETFPVQIKLQDVTDLVTFEFKLGYNTNILDIVDKSLTPPSVWGDEYVGHLILNNTVDEAAGLYQVTVAKTAASPSFDGSTSLATVTFQVTDTGTSNLDLYDTNLANSLWQPITHNVIDGYFGCSGDTNDDGNVDLDDLYYVLIAYGAKEGDPDYNPFGDLDNDGDVDLDDLYCVLINYGTVEEPSLLEESTSCQTLSDMVVSSSGKKCGDSGYDKIADVNEDRIIDMTDLTFLVIDNYQDEAWCEDRLNDYFDPCLTTTTIRRRCGGRGCPILKVYDGKEFVTVEKLDIHSPKDEDVTVTSTFTMEPIDGRYEIVLDEVAYLFWDGSHIDHVALTAEEGECQLISATHSKHGNVLSELIKSDDIRVRTFPGEEIKLIYEGCSGKEFTFSIEGYNKKMLGFEIPDFVIVMLTVIILFVIFAVMKFFVKK